MEYHVLSFASIILGLAYFLAGIVDGACGGGGLITMSVLMILGVPAHNIAPTNQASLAPGCLTSFVTFARSGKIDWKPSLIAVPFAIIGGIFGAKLNLIIPANVLKIIMLILVPVIGAVVILKKDIGKESRIETLSSAKVAIYAALIGLVVGGYQGFYGAGSGTLFMFGFALLLRMDLVTASGCTKVLCLSAILSATVTYIFSGKIIWLMVPVCMVFSILGNYVGSKLALTKGAKVIRPMFIAVLIGLIIKLFCDII